MTTHIKFHNEFIEPPEESYNIISCAVFRLRNNYKTEKIYSDGLNRLFIYFQKHYPDYYLRVYYDSSVLDYTSVNKLENTKLLWEPLFNLMRKSKKVQFVRYEMDKFRKDNVYHKGLIGTLVRLYPLFDTEDTKKIKTVNVMDIDFKYNELNRSLYNYKQFEKSQLDFFYRTRNCYELQDRFRILGKYFNLIFPIMAGTIISRLKIPIDIFNEFFLCLLDKNRKGAEYYKEFESFSYDKFHLNHDSEENEFKYGIDEVFTLILKDYLHQQKIKHLLLVDTDIAKPYYSMYTDYQKKKITKLQFENTVRFLLGSDFDIRNTPNDNYSKIDNVVYYGGETETLSKNIIFSRTMDLIKKIESGKLFMHDYGFSEDSIIHLKNTNVADTYHTIDYKNSMSEEVLSSENLLIEN